MATQIAERTANPVTVFRQTISTPAFREQLKMALPSHISVEKFERVATTAVQANPSLLDPQKVERSSLFGALVRAAQDGLLPDGREGAIVPFKGKAQWMPMVAGIMVKVRRSGEIASWDAFPVYEKDEFDYLLGDRPQIHHRPYRDGEPGEVVGAYSVVTFKDGTISKDYMPRWRIEKARNQNPIGRNSLMWTQFYDEGAVKTVIRHHAKRLPQSTDIEATFERDESLNGPVADRPAVEAVPPPASLSRLDALEHHIEQDNEISTAAGTPPAEAEPHPTADEAAAPAKQGGDLLAKMKRVAAGTAHQPEGRDESEMGETPTLDQAKAALDQAKAALDGCKSEDAVQTMLDSFRGQLGDEDLVAASIHANGIVATRWAL